MLRFSRVMLAGVSPFSVFLMDQRNNPDLEGLSFVKRGKELARLYKQLSKADRSSLSSRARKMPSLKNTRIREKERRARNRKYTGSSFSKFIKENKHKVSAMPNHLRFAALSELYKLQKPIDLEKEMRALGFSEDVIRGTVPGADAATPVKKQTKPKGKKEKKLTETKTKPTKSTSRSRSRKPKKTIK